MEKNANYTVVGLLSLALLFGLTVFIVWLAKFQFSQSYDLYDIVFQGPVRGLSQGGEVHFNGIKVGEVTKLMLDRRNPRQVIAEARLTAGVPVRRDSYATLEPQGITGINYVQISAGSPGAPLLKSTVPPGVTPTLPGRRSALDDLLQGGGTAMTQAVEALARVNRVLSDDNIAAFSSTLSDARAIGDELRARKAMVSDAQKTIRDADAAAVQLLALETSGQGLVDGDAKRTVRAAGDAAEQAAAMARQLRGMIARLEGPTTQFATEGLPQATATLIELQRTSESLNRLLIELQSNPRGALLKPPAHDLEVKP